jgi:hypothetical protein
MTDTTPVTDPDVDLALDQLASLRPYPRSPKRAGFSARVRCMFGSHNYAPRANYPRVSSCTSCDKARDDRSDLTVANDLPI